MARIVINPTTFRNRKDAACVAWNEALRLAMEANGFDPASEPTEDQRKRFADTAYADDENMLRRTILARICVMDDSVADPTDEQLQEASEFLGAVLECGFPSNAYEQNAVMSMKAVVDAALGGQLG